MKRLAFLMAVLAIGACSKGEKAASTPASDSGSSMMMMSDSTHMMGHDTTKPK